MALRDRVQGWLTCGPIGHLYATTADVVVLWVRWGAGALRHRLAPR